jgi:peptidoglycan lytic transglycosylase
MLFAAARSAVAFTSLLSIVPGTQSAHDNTLATVRRSDRDARDANGQLTRLPTAEHLRRANVYMTNRAFEEAREHWQALIKYYPEDSAVPEALLGIGRSYFQSRNYAEAYETFDKLAHRYPSTKEGREGLNFSGSALLRLGRPADAVNRYIEYINRFPDGERIDTAHLNVIDGLREAGKNQEAIAWVGRTSQRFAGTPTELNALFARLRLEVAEGNWKQAVSVADTLNRRSFQRGVLTTTAEVAYLKAYSLEQAGKRDEAIGAYLSIPDGLNAYYGWLASERLLALANDRTRTLVSQRVDRVNAQILGAENLYPAPYRQTIVRTAKARKIDPRFVLAIIRQESVFRPLAKSPAGARGLLQLTIDAAQKYASSAGLNALRESELYRPETSILVGSEYLAHLVTLFPNMLEPVAASYNGGEDNVARWVQRAKQRDPGVFTAEIGFDETKAYVQSVMANYRAYRQLYTADLERR